MIDPFCEWLSGLGQPLAVPPRAYLDEVKWSERLHPENGWYHSWSWNPILHKKAKAECDHSSFLASWLWMQSRQLPQARVTTTSQQGWIAISNKPCSLKLLLLVHLVKATRKATKTEGMQGRTAKGLLKIQKKGYWMEPQTSNAIFSIYSLGFAYIHTIYLIHTFLFNSTQTTHHHIFSQLHVLFFLFYQ